MSQPPSTTGVSLLLTIAIDAGIQLIAYIISAIMRTERFYDLSGAITYFACTLVALLWRQDNPVSVSSIAPRQGLVAALVLVWCCRLGGFLFMRVLKVEDKRFDSFKTDPIKFAIPFILQVVWVFLTAFPVYIILANPGSTQPPFMWSDVIGLVIWVFGFTVEVVADAQKSAFKDKHPTEFISTGIWAYSRYANYFGEMTLWVGMFVLCAAGFVEPWQWVSIISPVFVVYLLMCVSGVKLGERNAEKRYGGRADYQAYKARTSKVVLWFPKCNVPVMDTQSAAGLAAAAAAGASDATSVAETAPTAQK